MYNNYVKATNAAAIFIENRLGYEIVTKEKMTIVARDPEGAIHVAKVGLAYSEMPPAYAQRSEMERFASEWVALNPHQTGDDGTKIIFDAVDILCADTDTGKAELRYRHDVLGETDEPQLAADLVVLACEFAKQAALGIQGKTSNDIELGEQIENQYGLYARFVYQQGAHEGAKAMFYVSKEAFGKGMKPIFSVPLVDIG